eukprot:2256228-Rhodomonas_salina.1
MGYRLIHRNWYKNVSRVPKWEGTEGCACRGPCTPTSCDQREHHIECTHHSCDNSVIQRRDFLDLDILPSKVGLGRGAFVRGPAARGQIIGEYTGEAITKAEHDRRQ